MKPADVKRGQVWQQGPTGKNGSARTVRVEYIYTSAPRCSVVPVDGGRRSEMAIATLLKSYTYIPEAK